MERRSRETIDVSGMRSAALRLRFAEKAQGDSAIHSDVRAAESRELRQPALRRCRRDSGQHATFPMHAGHAAPARVCRIALAGRLDISIDNFSEGFRPAMAYRADKQYPGDQRICMVAARFADSARHAAVFHGTGMKAAFLAIFGLLASTIGASAAVSAASPASWATAPARRAATPTSTICT